MKYDNTTRNIIYFILFYLVTVTHIYILIYINSAVVQVVLKFAY